MIEKKHLLNLIDETEKWAIDIRRNLHKWPELSNKEYKTRNKIERELNSFGILTERVLETGLVGILKEEKNKYKIEKTVAIRADMDALPIEEESNCNFSSLNKKVMHACGHDVHMAVLLGTAKVLSYLKEEINGNVKFIFQPAEETFGGALPMIKKGCLTLYKTEDEIKKLDYIIGIHVKPELTAGTIGLKYGKVHASSDMFRIIVKGKSCHGAYPDRGVDAIAISAQIVSNVQNIISRNISPMDSGVISFGSIHGGDAKNILADTVILEGIIRALDKSTREFLKDRLLQVSICTAKANRGEAKVIFEAGYPSLINDDKTVDLVKKSLYDFYDLVKKDNDYLTEEFKIVNIKNATMGVDDFSYFLEEVPGAFFFLGSGYEDKENSGLHSSNFNVNEDCIRTGILLEVLSCLKLLDTKII
ncbi:M20 metallopeptidase family protein [Anaerovorax odorimutans]|uniref:M20 metallopeptidase family protein n=1 Tax=Anaerovorax odorimutans TaxID=109327 RepID=UPI0003F8039B|nr:M20 family metallopeptidase [Anaerovorax odorimutans]